jgi:hypothetical protein
MKRKVLCIVLALLMCMMFAMPTFAESSTETPEERANVSASFGLTHVSGSTYRMWARITNPAGVSVSASLTLYNISYSQIASVSTSSTNTFINLSRNVTLSSGTYHLILIYTANGSTYSFEKTYTI